MGLGEGDRLGKGLGDADGLALVGAAAFCAGGGALKQLVLTLISTTNNSSRWMDLG